MKIYTRKGDTGKSSIIGKNAIFKSSVLFEALGSVDELNSLVGLSLCYIKDKKMKKDLAFIQNQLFLVGAFLSYKKRNKNYKKLILEYLVFLEKRIDDMEKNLPPLINFLLPGGSISASLIHLARSVTRRCERSVVKTKDYKELLPYINRLSDYFFVLARYLNKKEGVKEVIWKL